MSWTFVNVAVGHWKPTKLGQNNVKSIKGEGNSTKTPLNVNAPSTERHEESSAYDTLM